jgi:hypothetical protein
MAQPIHVHDVVEVILRLLRASYRPLSPPGGAARPETACSLKNIVNPLSRR